MRSRDIQHTIKQLYSDPNLDRLAEALYVKSSYLRDLVNHYFSCGPHCLIETVRLEQAVLLLHKPDMLMYAVGAEIGYRNPKTFRRAFKKRTGLSPQAFRERLAGSPDPQTEMAHMIDQLWRCCRRRFGCGILQISSLE